MNAKLAQEHASNCLDWEDQLTLTNLPVNPDVKQQVLSKINTRTANASNIAKILIHDPPLCLLLFHHANRSLLASDNESHDLSHVISLLGFPMVERTIKESTEITNQTFHKTEYLQQLNISIHAAYQAKAWTKKNRHWSPNELYWASLFLCSPLWALWSLAGEKMLELQQARAGRNGASHFTIEQNIFGVRLTHLCHRMSKEWFLPSASQQAWEESVKGLSKSWVTLSRYSKRPEQSISTAESLGQLCTSSAFAVNLANKMADETEWDWKSKRTLRLQHILAQSLHCSIDSAIAITHQNAAQASEYQGSSGTLSSAVQLLSYYKKQHFLEPSISVVDQPEKTQTKNEVPLEKPAPLIQNIPETINQQFEAAVTQLTNQPDSFGNLHDVMNLATSALCQHSSLERATVSLINTKAKEIRTYYSSGCEDSQSLKVYSHTLKKGDLFNKLLQKSVCLRLDKDNHAKIWPLLPENFKQASGVEEFFMMSLFANKRPIALLYADCGISHTLLDDQQYKQFKRLSQAVCKCLAHLQSKT